MSCQPAVAALIVMALGPSRYVHTVLELWLAFIRQGLSPVRHKSAVTQWQMACWLPNISPTCFQLETFLQILLPLLLFSLFYSFTY